MCNVEEEAEKVLYQVGNRDVEDCFASHLTDRFSPADVWPGWCLACNAVELDPDFMFPPDRMPRYMCDSCYRQIALGGPKYFCLSCGNSLPQYKLLRQNAQPRELKHAIHDGGQCAAYHWMLAGIVLGKQFRTRSVPMLPAGTPRPTLRDLFQQTQRFQEPVQAPRLRERRDVKFLKFPE
jgi:hypothetical protein